MKVNNLLTVLCTLMIISNINLLHAQSGKMITNTAPEFLQGNAQGEIVATEVPTVDFGTVVLISVTGDYTHWSNVVLGPDGRYYFGVGDHSVHVMLIAYDPVSKTDEICIDSRNVDGLEDCKWHGRPDINPETGDMYLLGFCNGDLVHYNIYSKEVVFHGKLVNSYSGFEEHTWDWQRNLLYGVAGSGELLVYDTEGDSVIYYGIPTTGKLWEQRSRLLDRETGILYGSDFDGDLMQYNPADHSFTKLNSFLDASLRSWTNSKDGNGAFWVCDRGGDMYKFFPEQDKVELMGDNIFGGVYVTFIEKSPGGRYLYYSSAHRGDVVVQYDMKTNQKKIIAFLDAFYIKNHGYLISGFFGGALSADGSSLFLVCNGNNDQRSLPAMFHVHIPASERMDDNFTDVNKQDDDLMPSGLKLSQNYPNPFNPQTTIKYNLNKSNTISLKIYNLSGQEIETLVNRFQTIGEHEITWQPKGLPSGIYFFRLESGKYSETKKLILQK